MIVTPWNQNLCMASFDISNMYTNIPTDQLPDIISILCNHYNIDPQLRSEILHLCKVVLSQNYFTFLSSTYHQHNGLAMGAPTSSIFSEIYLQYSKDTQLLDILTRHDIISSGTSDMQMIFLSFTIPPIQIYRLYQTNSMTLHKHCPSPWKWRRKTTSTY